MTRVSFISSTKLSAARIWLSAETRNITAISPRSALPIASHFTSRSWRGMPAAPSAARAFQYARASSNALRMSSTALSRARR